MTTAVPYCRTSTDDKGQDPRRQLEEIGPWAEREGLNLLDAVVDEGTSASKTNPFERPLFVAACERAKAAGAVAIVVEIGDRFTRQGSKEAAWAEVELERRYGLALWRADKPLSQHGTMMAAVTDTIHDEGARAWVESHKKKVRSGMAKAKAAGTHVGRPRKELSDEERALVDRMRGAGKGWRLIAHEVSKARGAFDVADPGKRRARSVSHMHVRRAVEGRQPVTKPAT